MRRLPASSMLRLALVVSSLAASPVHVARAQVAVALADRGPRFLLAPIAGGAPVEVDASRSVLLRREVSLKLDGATVGRMLTAIEAQTGLRFVYSRAVVPVDKPVALRADSITVAAALTEILLDTNIDVVVARDGQLTLTKRSAPRLISDTGAVVGRVTDKKAGTAIVGATVLVEGTRYSAATGSDGRYRIAEVPQGSYTVRARYIGYAPGAITVSVRPDQEATADFGLEKSVQRLDEVVTTGTVVPTEVKALPTPVSVISDSFIAQQRPHDIQELLRQAVPSAVSWDAPGFSNYTWMSVRGASTMSGLVGQIKVFVDGVEAATHSQAAVDPTSIERIEVVRGPEASAIYGSDAIGGVIQIFTKHGDAGLTRPEVDAEASGGVVQTPYAGYGGVLRQKYTASMRGGGSDVSYNFGAGYSRTGDFLPNGEISRQSNPSIYGGMHYARGIVTADVSGRYFVQNNPYTLNPALLETGFSFFSKPFDRPYQYQNQTIGARISIATTNWWEQRISVGLDHYTSDWAQTRPRLITPDDTLLNVGNVAESKASIGYNTSVHGRLGAGVSGSLTAGFDHYSLNATDWLTGGALNTIGGIETDPNQPVNAERFITNNTGYFAQAQVGLLDRLYLTGGVRAEQNSNFGDSLGTPLSPRVGISYVQGVGGSTVKLRGSWGRAIHAPSPGLKEGSVDPLGVTLANPRLGPERQKGGDVGVDVFLGSRASASVTYFNQTAEGLIQYVRLQSTTVPTSQYQNVGEIKNSGVELESSIQLGSVQLRGQYAYTRARIQRLAPGYTGDFRVGDQAQNTPKHTAGAGLSFSPFPRMALSAGFTWFGSWTNYDDIGEFSCFGGTAPCRATSRDYLISYPGFVKVNATLSQQITALVSGFVSVDNLTNNQASEIANSSASIGRITTIGLRFHY